MRTKHQTVRGHDLSVLRTRINYCDSCVDCGDEIMEGELGGKLGELAEISQKTS